jgi:hypothetical protein
MPSIFCYDQTGKQYTLTTSITLNNGANVWCAAGSPGTSVPTAVYYVDLNAGNLYQHSSGSWSIIGTASERAAGN